MRNPRGEPFPPPAPRLARCLPRSALRAIGAAAIAIAAAPAHADALWQAELRAGYGLAMSGRGTQMSRRPTPLTVAATASYAFEVAPPLAAYGGLLIETLDRNAAGAVAGIRLSPEGSPLRLSAGGTTLVAPYTLWGATAGIGVCGHITARVSLCSDAELTAYIAGTDLPDEQTVTQGQLVLGLVFDAL